MHRGVLTWGAVVFCALSRYPFLEDRTLTTSFHPDQAAFHRYLAHLQTQRAQGVAWPAVDFEAMLKVMSICSWEVVPTRRHQTKVQFLYGPRPPGDLAYPPHPQYGPALHFYGTNNRGEHSDIGLERVNGKYSPHGKLFNLRFVGAVNWYKDPRGPVVGMVHLGDYLGDNPLGTEWRDWDDIPSHMIDSHRILVTKVAQTIADGDQRPWLLDDPR